MEIIVPTKYLNSPEAEVGSFCGVAYKLPDGSNRTELIWGTNKWVGICISLDVGDGFIFTVNHVFVGRYIDQCLKLPQTKVEIFRFHLIRGAYEEKPDELGGELVDHFFDNKENHVWCSYEHISGPYLADTMLIVSKFSSRRTYDISAKISVNLIPDRLQYLAKHDSLPMIGVLPSEDGIDTEIKHLEDLLLSTKKKKPTVIQ